MESPVKWHLIIKLEIKLSSPCFKIKVLNKENILLTLWTTFSAFFFSIAQIYFDSCLQLNPPDSIFPWFKQSWDLSDFLCLDVVLCWSTDLILSAVVVIMELTPRKKKKEKKGQATGWEGVKQGEAFISSSCFSLGRMTFFFFSSLPHLLFLIWGWNFPSLVHAQGSMF